MTFLRLEGNAIGKKRSGTLPASYSSLFNLRRLDISYQECTGGIPESWRSMTNLVEVRSRNADKFEHKSIKTVLPHCKQVFFSLKGLIFYKFILHYSSLVQF